MVRQSGIIKKSIEKITALYVRLSRDDDNEGDSNSISHQIEILKKYCRDHGITNYKIYKDDGYSGTSFQRPGFLEMLADIEAGLVGTVIVKDMSRFGRNYLEVGLYTEIRFPEMGVHFIAVNDGVDSEDEGNDFTPFRNIINEWYAKDTSKKIRAVFRSKGMQGKRMSGKPPYGYFNGPDGHLIVDEETAPIVKLIYQLCVEGNGPGKIARILTERKIPTPSTTIFQRTGQTQFYHPEDPFFWTSSTVSHILEKDVYIGRTTNFKTYKLSYKSKKQIENPPEKQMVFENTHPALVDLETWELVQKNRVHRKRPQKKNDEVHLFSGMLFCPDCGARLVHQSRQKNSAACYVCGTYKHRKQCTPHIIRDAVLEQLVLQNLQRISAYAQEDESELVDRIIARKTDAKRKERERAERILAKHERRSAELDAIIQKLFESNVLGQISDERFVKLSENYEREQAQLAEEMQDLRTVVNTYDTEVENAEKFLGIVRKYTDPTELTPMMLHELVEKVIVREGDKSSGHRMQRIDIYYTFVGEIEFSPEFIESGRHDAVLSREAGRA